MKYRHKVLLLVVGIIVLSNGVLLYLSYSNAREILTNEMRSKVMSIAASTASLIDAELHSSIITREDEGSLAYNTIADQLRKVRDANKRDDIQVQFVYTMILSGNEQYLPLFVVDAEESQEDKSHVGDVYKGVTQEPLSLEKIQGDREFTVDQWGTWLSGSAPIRNNEGKGIAILGVDVSASEVNKKIKSLQRKSWVAFGLSIAFGIAISGFIAGKVRAPITAICDAIENIGKGKLDTRLSLCHNDEFNRLAVAINDMAIGLQDKEALKGLLARYVSKDVAEQLMSSGKMQSLEGDRRKITVLFSDIRGFTTISETMRPEAVVAILNEYFEKMIEVVFKYRGTLDKFMGDGLMAVFGAPLEDKNQEENAVQAALEMQEALHLIIEKNKTQKKLNLKIGIGISSGDAIVGNIGSMQRMEYTAIGDTVNLASRLESKTKDLGVDLLISEYTYNSVKSLFETKSMGSVQVRGRKDSVNVYTVEKLRS